jgi:O-Antigen ligase
VLAPAQPVSAPRAAAFPWQALVPALALPVIFLHVRYQPKVSFGLGSTSVGIELSDVAVLAVVLAGALEGMRRGWGVLRPGRRLWLAGGAFLALVVVDTVHPLLWQDDYHFLKHLVTAAKFCEYGLLAPALVLLLRSRRDALPLLWTAVTWSVAATGWGLLQFAGLVSELEGKRPLQREPSFLGIHDFAALSGAALVLALAVLVLGPASRSERLLAWIAGPAGVVGLALSSAAAGAIGVALAAVALVALAAARHELSAARALLVAGVAGAAALGVLLMRNGDVPRAIRAVGIGSKPKPQLGADIESYAHRSLLGYIGLRIFADHPVAGVGWQGSEELENYGPYLADAHRRYPNEPAVAFPSPQHAWGVQNGYLQTLADLGVIGFALLVALLVGAVTLGARAALRATPGAVVPVCAGLLWLLVAAGVWNGLGLVAGIPLDALTWMGVGLIGAAAAWTADGAR